MKRLQAILIAGALSASALVPLGIASAQSSGLPEGPGKVFAQQNCSGCHSIDLVTAQRRTPDEWEEILNRMIANGDSLSDEQYDEVLGYLGTYLGKDTASAASEAPALASNTAAGHAPDAHQK